MRNTFVSAISAVLLVGLLAGFSFGDVPSATPIPADVEFHAIQDEAWNSTTNPNPWSYVSGSAQAVDGYGLPSWSDNSTLVVDNNPSNLSSLVWLKIDFTDEGMSLGDNIGVSLTPASGVAVAYTFIQLDNSWIWQWKIDPQPANQTLTFTYNIVAADIAEFKLLGEAPKAYVTGIEVASQTVPVPSALVLCGIGLGFMGVVRRIRRK